MKASLQSGCQHEHSDEATQRGDPEDASVLVSLIFFFFLFLQDRTLTPLHERRNECVLKLPVELQLCWCGLKCRRQTFFPSPWPAKDEMLESTLRDWVEEWAERNWEGVIQVNTHTHRVQLHHNAEPQLQAPLPVSGTVKVKQLCLLSFYSIRLWTFMQT